MEVDCLLTCCRLLLYVVWPAVGGKARVYPHHNGICHVFRFDARCVVFTKPVSMWISESFLAERITADPIAQFIRRMLVPS